MKNLKNRSNLEQCRRIANKNNQRDWRPWAYPTTFEVWRRRKRGGGGRTWQWRSETACHQGEEKKGTSNLGRWRFQFQALRNCISRGFTRFYEVKCFLDFSDLTLELKLDKEFWSDGWWRVNQHNLTTHLYLISLFRNIIHVTKQWFQAVFSPCIIFRTTSFNP